ncbi:MAG: ATP-binding protein [Spirochaetales bacterium]|nr:ATP-binding protein [Spirochaetales bacterium]
MNTVVLTGPECTGKSTLARGLAAEYGTVFVPETARDYAEKHKRERGRKHYSYEEIEGIARMHLEAIEKQKTLANRFLFIDTHLVIFKVWFLREHRRCPDWIDIELNKNPCSLYLLCLPDIPWHPDSARQHGGKARDVLFELYKQELDEYRLPWQLVQGAGRSRFDCAVTRIRSHFSL